VLVFLAAIVTLVIWIALTVSVIVPVTVTVSGADRARTVQSSAGR